MNKLIAIVCVLLLCGCQKSVDFVDAHGNGHSFTDYKGKWVLVNYWATWCAPCIKEIPELNRLAKTHADKLVVLGVDYDQPTGSQLLAQIRKMKIEYPVISKDPRKRLGIKEPEVLPTTYVFAPGMKFKTRLVGPQTEAGILALINQPTS